MKSLLILLFNIFLFQSYSQYSDIEKKLFELPDVLFRAVDVPSGYEAAYELSVKQPVDHNNPEKGHFYQRVFLCHKSFLAPVVYVTEGYEQERIRGNELSVLLHSNQIEVEHRYFGKSIPDKTDYSYLTVEQEAKDLHRIRELFKIIYPGKWVSTGISKGGQNSIFYRYLYPDDVDVTIPYVAPLNLSKSDERIFTFFDTISNPQCRKQIRDFQFRMLKEREKIIPFLEWYCKGRDLEFSYLNIEQAFEYTVLEYEFSFWQWGHRCSDIPPPGSNLEDAINHLLRVSEISFFSDESMEALGSHYYQAAAELGYYSYRTDGFEGLLVALPLKPYPSAIFPPGKIPVEYDNTLSQKVFKWTQNNNEEIVYIYGAADTWSATSIPPSEASNSYWYFIKDASHGTARISGMNPAQKEHLIAILEKWLSIDIE